MKHLEFVLIMSVTALLASCSKDSIDLTDSSNLNGRTSAIFNSSLSYGVVTDADGNIYKTIKIGDKTWMAENLRTTILNDSTSINWIPDEDVWASVSSSGYCNYNNTKSLDTIATFGRLYNWYAVDSEILAPEGWHIATLEEWQELANIVGGASAAAGILREAGLTHWMSDSFISSNMYGFTALPSGNRSNEGVYQNLGGSAYWWAADTYNTYYAYRMAITSGSNELVEGYLHKRFGFAVRCVKD